jgi:hypothetical protein
VIPLLVRSQDLWGFFQVRDNVGDHFEALDKNHTRLSVDEVDYDFCGASLRDMDHTLALVASFFEYVRALS